MQSRVLTGNEFGARGCQQGLEITLDVVEIHGTRRYGPLLGNCRAGSQGCKHHRLVEAVDRRTLGGAGKATAGFKDPDTRDLPIPVGNQVADEPGDQARAHHAQLARDRVREPDRRGVAGEVLFPALLDESEIDHLLVVTIREPMTHCPRRAAGFGAREHGQRP